LRPTRSCFRATGSYPGQSAVKKRFSVEQIVAVLKQVELGMPVADVIRQVGISEQTFSLRLKKLVAELSLDKAILQDINAKKWPGAR